MKDSVYTYIKEKHPNYRGILDHFDAVPEAEIRADLLLLELDGAIDKVKDRYYTAADLNMIPGTVTAIRDRFAFASVAEDEDVYIPISCLKNAFLDDRVLLRRVSEPWMDREEYEVVKIVRRARKELVGEVRIYGGIKTLHAEKIARPDFLFLIHDQALPVQRNQIVRARIGKITMQTAVLEVLEIIGNKNDVGVDVARIILANNAPLRFPEETVAALSAIPEEVSLAECAGREDFSSHMIVTIDGEDAKDFDDAVEVQKEGNCYRIGVHIADVAHYVQENSPLDKEALNRATSLYVQDRVVPMLPFELSNGICSLNPHVRRLTTSCIFTVDSRGKILESRIVKGVICSAHRLTYTYVNQFLEKDRNEKKSFTPLEKMLIELEEASAIIRKRRRKAGSVELSSSELTFSLGDDGVPTAVGKRVQRTGERLIEDLMICANEIVASTIERMKLPMVYRVHGKPKAKKMEAFQRIASAKGYPCDIDPLKCRPADLAKYLASVNDPEDREILSSLLLRCMAKAKYSVQNEKHFGLASASYTHFTSPIRRYPDLMVHRLIDRYLVQGERKVDASFSGELAQRAYLSSVRERRALTIERAVEGLLCAKYMQNHLGEAYPARIVSMVNTGMFVEIPCGIQGLLPFDSVPGDFYVFDEATYRAYGTRKGKVFSLGDRLQVMVCSVDIDHGQVGFALTGKVVRKGGKRDGRRH